MTRVFITTKKWKAVGMYKDTDPIYKKIDNDFEKLPQIYTLGNTFMVIILNDSFKDWYRYNINRSDDYILYHEGSTEDVIETITNSFEENHRKPGNHIEGQYYDSLFKILFDDNENDKSNKILKILGFTEQQIIEKDNFKSKLNLLHKCLSLETLHTITDPDLEKLTSDEKSGFNAFKINVGSISDPLSGEYFKHLTSLRTRFLSLKQ